MACFLTLSGCALINLPTGTSRPQTQVPVGRGAVRHFPLPSGQTNLAFPASRNLVILLSASSSAPPAVGFRVVEGGLKQSPANQAVGSIGNEARFTADGLRYHGPYGVPIVSRPLGARRIQAAFSLGDEVDFWVNTGNSQVGGDCHRRGKLTYVSAHAYYFVDVGPTDDEQGVCGAAGGPAPAPELLRGLAAAFEGQSPLVGSRPIYETVTHLYGPDPEGGGIDGDPRTFVVLSPAVDRFGQEKGLLGYYWSRDVQPRSLNVNDPRSHSNEREAIFLTNQIFNQRPYTTFGTLAHEFTHLVLYYQRSLVGSTSEETWWEEALSMLAMDQTGFGLRAGNEDIAKDIKSFLERPAAYSLTQWAGNPNEFAYGLVYVFARFLFDRYGPSFIREIVTSPQGGLSAIDRALRRRGTTFQQVYTDFGVAIFVSGSKLEVEPRYQLASDVNMRQAYGSILLEGIRSKTVSPVGSGENALLRPWGTAYYNLSQEASGQWSFSFQVPGPIFGSAIGW